MSMEWSKKNLWRIPNVFYVEPVLMVALKVLLNIVSVVEIDKGYTTGGVLC